MQNASAILLISCPDQKGLVNIISEFIATNNGNIIDLEQHVDHVDNMFFLRVEWELKDFNIAQKNICTEFESSVAIKLNKTLNWSIHFSATVPKMAIFVSKYSHCLFDLLSRYQSNEWRFEIPLVISNHNDLAESVQRAGFAFHHIPVNKDNKKQAQTQQLSLLKEHGINIVVLARYMQILSSEFIDEFPNKIINIHHSFLPAFPGAKPYHSAYQRGVKIIGATSHYVTSELDAGPIIDQDVERVRHTDNIEDLILKGQDIEKIVLARAIWKHINYKTLVYNNRTIVFE